MGDLVRFSAAGLLLILLGSIGAVATATEFKIESIYHTFQIKYNIYLWLFFLFCVINSNIELTVVLGNVAV